MGFASCECIREGGPDALRNFLPPGLNPGSVDLAAARAGPWRQTSSQVEIMLPCFPLAASTQVRLIGLSLLNAVGASFLVRSKRGSSQTYGGLTFWPMETVLYLQSLLPFCWRQSSISHSPCSSQGLMALEVPTVLPCLAVPTLGPGQ